MGSYYSTNSLIHKLDARTKLFIVSVVSLSLFLNKAPIALACWAAIIAVGVSVSNVPYNVVFQNLKFMSFLLLITFCINALVGSAGQTELFRLFNVSIYSENLIYAGLLCVRVILLILLVTLFTLTTSHLEITDAIIWGIRPTAVLKFPVMQFAFILTLTMRFIAIIRDDVERLKKAQSARGANFSGTIRRKVQLLKPLVAPLLLSLFQRAEEISEAMSARCFANESLRLRLKKYKWNLKEIAALGIVTVVFSLLNF